MNRRMLSILFATLMLLSTIATASVAMTVVDDDEIMFFEDLLHYEEFVMFRGEVLDSPVIVFRELPKCYTMNLWLCKNSQ